MWNWMERTNLYFSGTTEEFRLQTKIDINPKDKWEKQCSDDEMKSDEDISGIVDWGKLNEKYYEIMEKVNSSSINSDFSEEVDSQNIVCPFENNIPDDNDAFIENSKDSMSRKIEVIYRLEWLKQRPKLVQRKMEIEGNMIKEIVNEFKLKKIILKYRTSSKPKDGSKIKIEHLNWIKAYISQMDGQHFTLVDLWTGIVKEFPELREVSLSSMSLLMRRKLGMSYNKLGKNPPNTDNNNDNNKIINWKKIIYWLTHNNYHVLYFDEFTVNHKTVNQRGWWMKGTNGWRKFIPQSFNMGFVISFSEEQIEGVMGFKTNINSSKLILFLTSVLERVKLLTSASHKRIAMVCDNWAYHKTEEVRNFLKKNQVLMIWIVPYSPFLNPWEHLIQGIKAKIKRDHNKRR